MLTLDFLSVSEYFSELDPFVYVKERGQHIKLCNSFCPGAITVIIKTFDDMHQAYNLFKNGALIDKRFPRTYGEQAKLEKSGLFPFDFTENELIIDFRTQSVTIPTVETQSVTLCPCGCNNILSGRQKSFSSTCRKRLSRSNNE